MSRPRLLDLFCGAGGAGMGYHRAGFDVVGVDLEPQPRYPFEFIRGDALAFLEAGGARGFDAIHASPPCQRWSISINVWEGGAERHPDLIEPTRELLAASGLPWAIENVPRAPLRNAILLCGMMFDGLKVYRHRRFETSPAVWWPPWHGHHAERPAAVGRPVPEHGFMTVAGHFIDVPAARRAMGIDWPMSRAELAEAIPPAFTEWVGRELMAHVRVPAE